MQLRQHLPAACDFVIELTAKLDSDKLRRYFSSATETLVPDSDLAWEFYDFFEVGEYFRPSVMMKKQGDGTRVEIYIEDKIIATGTLNRLLNTKEKIELKMLSSIFANQQRHISLCLFDQLTGVMNRQAFNEKIKAFCKGTQYKNRRNAETPRSLCLLDVDHFKKVNDKFGHLIGDEVLVIVGQMLNATFREEDFCFRYGGEEFAIILSNVDIQQALMILNRLRISIESHKFPQVGKITVSMGVVEYTPFAQPSELIEKADKALYYAKEHGRNQVCSYKQLVSDGLIPMESSGSDIEFL